jgi:hypothetical protein
MMDLADRFQKAVEAFLASRTKQQTKSGKANVGNSEPHFAVDPVFANASYSDRYRIFCERLVKERLYDAACLTLSKNATPVTYSRPSVMLSFQRLVAQLQGHAVAFIQSQTTPHPPKP